MCSKGSWEAFLFFHFSSIPSHIFSSLHFLPFFWDSRRSAWLLVLTLKLFDVFRPLARAAPSLWWRHIGTMGSLRDVICDVRVERQAWRFVRRVTCKASKTIMMQWLWERERARDGNRGGVWWIRSWNVEEERSGVTWGFSAGVKV